MNKASIKDYLQDFYDQYKDIAATLRDVTNTVGTDIFQKIHPEVLGRTPPLLYHYTTANGLKGIIDSNSIWATHHRFLNDKTEYTYGKELVEKTLDEMMDSAKSDETTHDLIRKLKKRLKAPSYGTYVACLSEEKDQLSQWKGYSDNGLGYSIGFEAGKLPSPIKLTYDEEDRQSHLFDLTKRIKSILNKKPNITEENEEVWLHLLGYLTQAIIYRCKHESFKEEKEWRLVIYNPSDDDATSSEQLQQLKLLLSEKISHHDKDLQFREHDGVLIPYIEIPFKTAKYPPINEIIIGPSHDPEKTERAKESIALLLIKAGFTQENMPHIEKSRIPYG